jgi:hypothetical protein
MNCASPQISAQSSDEEILSSRRQITMLKARFTLTFKPAMIFVVFGLIFALVLSGVSQADFIVAPGWDLLDTLPGTNFLGIPFTGVDLGSFNFGGPIGVKGTGNTDTIVQRLAAANTEPGPGTDTIPIELVALQLVSVNPIDLGAGPDFHYVTLQSARGGPASTGSMDITFNNPNGGIFDSLINVFFDIRMGSLNGPIILSNNLPLTSDDVPWGRIAPPGAVTIPGVNLLLKGNGTPDQDFWPIGPFDEGHPQALHRVQAATPEPSSLLLLGIGILGILGYGWRKRKKAA